MNQNTEKTNKKEEVLQKDIFLSVIIPAYNESERIGVTLKQVSVFLDQQSYESEIIVVDDGSTDNLREVVRKHMKWTPKIKIISYEKNSGKGHAVKMGMRNASGKHRLFMDADNSVTIDNVPRFIAEAEAGCDVVIGSIMLPDSHAFIDKNGWHRIWLRKLTRFVRSLLVDIDVYDTQRGFKLFSENAAKKLFSLQRVDRFGFDMELLALAKTFNYKIREVAVTWVNPAGSKVTAFSYVQALMELINIRINMLFRRYDF